MHLILVLIQALNIFLAITSIVYGIISYKKLKDIKSLLLLPVYSILQVLFSEMGKIFFQGKYILGSVQYLSVAIYVIIEFIIVIYFYKIIFNSQFLKKVIKLSIYGSSLAIILDVLVLINSKKMFIFLFHYFSGFTIEILSFLGCREILKNIEIENIFLKPNSIMTFGILFAFTIITPFSILQNFLIAKNSIYYELLFLTNSLGYFILFSFLIFSIYVSRKSRDF